MKKSIIIVLLATVCLNLWGCSPQKQSTVPAALNRNINLINPTGPLIIPIIALAKGQVTNEPPVNINYWKSNDEIAAFLSSQDADFAVLPVTTGANLYAQQNNLTLVGVHEWKVFYMLAADNAAFSGWQSMKGKTIYTPPSRGNTVDVLIRAAVTATGLQPDTDVKILYLAPQEIVSLFQAGKIEYAALPEPFISAAMAKQTGKIVLDFQKYWHELTGQPERLPIAGLFVRKEFLAAYPEAVARLETSFAQSVQWCQDNPDQAVELSQTDLNLPAPVIKSALERIEFYYLPIKECQNEVQTYLSTMRDMYPEGIPALPDSNFYKQ